MTSPKKIAANQNIAKKSPGPTTEPGKRRSRGNATKHSILARELIVNEIDKPQLETVRAELHDQLSPVTQVQRIAFERFLCSFWRHKLAVRLDAKQMECTFDQTDEKKNPEKEVPAIHAEDWKPEVIRVFGENFFSMLTEWVPTNIDEILGGECSLKKTKDLTRLYLKINQKLAE